MEKYYLVNLSVLNIVVYFSYSLVTCNWYISVLCPTEANDKVFKMFSGLPVTTMAVATAGIIVKKEKNKPSEAILEFYGLEMGH